MTSIRTLFLCSALTALAATTGCVVSQQDFNTLQSQVYAQQNQQLQMAKRLDKIEQDLAQAQSRFQQEISRTSGPVQATQANLWSEMESLRVQVATLKGELESVTRTSAQTTDETQAREKTLDELTREVEAMKLALSSQLGLDLAQVAKEEAMLNQPSSTGAAQQPADPAKALYSRALDAFKASRYADAQSMWEEFAKSFPKHDLTDNAIFWQGESFYQMKDYARAVLKYQEVITKHPKSNKYPAALLKQGMSFIKRGNDKAGREVLQDLIKKHPGSAEAARAKTVLANP